MSNLNRIKVGDFDIKDAVTIDELKQGKNAKFISIEEFFKDKDKIDINAHDLKILFNGVKLQMDLDDGIYRVYNMDSFIGTAIVKNGVLKRDIIKY